MFSAQIIMKVRNCNFFTRPLYRDMIKYRNVTSPICLLHKFVFLAHLEYQQTVMVSAIFVTQAANYYCEFQR